MGKFLVSFIILACLATLVHVVVGMGTVWAIWEYINGSPEVYAHGWIDPYTEHLQGAAAEFLEQVRDYWLGVVAFSAGVSILWIFLATFVLRPVGPGDHRKARIIWLMLTIFASVIAAFLGPMLETSDAYGLALADERITDLRTATLVAVLVMNYFLGAYFFTPKAVRPAIFLSSWLRL